MEQLGLYADADDVVERVELTGAGRVANLGRWLDQWRGRGDVRVLVALDGTHAVAVRR